MKKNTKINTCTTTPCLKQYQYTDTGTHIKFHAIRKSQIVLKFDNIKRNLAEVKSTIKNCTSISIFEK